MSKPTDITRAKFSEGSITLHKNNEIKINICIRTIHPLRCPIFFVRYGI